MLNRRVRRHRQDHPDQAKIQQQTVGRGFGRQGGHVGARAIGAINGAEHRIGALARLESLLQVRGSEAPSVAGIVTTSARALVRPQLGEKWVRGINLLLAEGCDGAAGILERFLKGTLWWCGHNWRLGRRAAATAAGWKAGYHQPNNRQQNLMPTHRARAFLFLTSIRHSTVSAGFRTVNLSGDNTRGGNFTLTHSNLKSRCNSGGAPMVEVRNLFHMRAAPPMSIPSRVPRSSSAWAGVCVPLLSFDLLMDQRRLVSRASITRDFAILVL